MTGGSFTWGIASDYREALPASDGTRAATSPASFVNDLAQFPLEPASSELTDSGGSLKFAGTVRIGSVAGIWGNFLSLTDPSVDIHGDTGTITATTSGMSHEQFPNVTEERLALATLDLGAATKSDEDGIVRLADVPTTLTEAGRAAILKLENGSSFSLRDAGAALDPVTIVFNYEAPVQAEPESAAFPSIPVPRVTLGSVSWKFSDQV